MGVRLSLLRFSGVLTVLLGILVFGRPDEIRSRPAGSSDSESTSRLPGGVPTGAASSLTGVFSLLDNSDPLSHHQSRVVLIVLDGVRTDEVFMGPWAGSGRRARRRHPSTVMPFIYGTLVRERNATLLGNRFGPARHRCLVNNNRFISLPGYADLLGAVRQPNVKSNRFRSTVRHPTVVDRLVQRGVAPDEMAVFASWKHIRNVVSRQGHDGLHLETGRASGDARPPWRDARYDADLMRSIDDYLNGADSKRLRFLFVSFNDTDEWAHKRNYGEYVRALQRQDDYIRRIYTTLESRPAFRDRTTYIITTDHGRGVGRNWAHHGPFPGSQYIWAVVHSPRPRFVSILEHTTWQRQLYANCSHTSIGRFLFLLLNASSARTVELGKKSGLR